MRFKYRTIIFLLYLTCVNSDLVLQGTSTSVASLKKVFAGDMDKVDVESLSDDESVGDQVYTFIHISQHTDTQFFKE